MGRFEDTVVATAIIEWPDGSKIDLRDNFFYSCPVGVFHQWNFDGYGMCSACETEHGLSICSLCGDTSDSYGLGI